MGIYMGAEKAYLSFSQAYLKQIGLVHQLFQALYHIVELLRQKAELIVPLNLDGNTQVAARRFLHGVRQELDGGVYLPVHKKYIHNGRDYAQHHGEDQNADGCG